MSNPTWPTILPSFPMYEAAMPYSDNLVRFSPEVGPEIVRRRATVVGGETSYNFILNTSEAQAFDSFYKSDLAGGSLRFDGLSDPLGNASTWAFKSPPKLVVVDKDVFQLTVELQVVP